MRAEAETVILRALDAATNQSIRSRDHGPAHWRAVARLAVNLNYADAVARGDATTEPVTCLLFGLLHDCQRASEYSDPEHGPRAAKLARRIARRLKLPLTSQQLDVLCYALEHHDRGAVALHPVVAACWDADRLTLGRVGERVDPALLSTAAVAIPGALDGWLWRAQELTRSQQGNGWSWFVDRLNEELQYA
jgi:uncharacterized protein